jgi:signal transduction histidine kinase
VTTEDVAVGDHGVVSAKMRSGNGSKRTKESTFFLFRRSRMPTLQNWAVSWRLMAVLVMAVIMGLVFGGLRVLAAVDSAAQFSRVSQLANLGQQVTGLVQALEDERDETTGIIPVASSKTAAVALQHWYNATDAAAAGVRRVAVGVGSSFPANIQTRVNAVLSVINHLAELRSTAQASQSALAVIADYSGPIGEMFSLNDQIAQGTADSGLANDVQALNSLSLAKDQAAQQRAILFNALTQQLFADDEQQALTTAVSVQSADLTAFDTTATPEEQVSFRDTVAGPLVNKAELLEEYVLSVDSLDVTALGIKPGQAAAQWYSAMSSTIDKMQAVELKVARNIVARSYVLQRGAVRSALFTAILTLMILLLVLIATLVVTRSLVLPLRRLRAGALAIATVQLPERVRRLGEAADPEASLEVAPIDVLSTDEIGQVARAFDQVHAEAVRLAGNEAMLRGSFNAMFVNLSRRSQSLIERLARMIDSLEQNEEDPDRLSDLFTMDHLVTRMRRNSENLLLLAGHEGARKWSDPVPLTDVIRAAISEIEHYSRVVLHVQPGIAVSGQTVSDVVRVLAELIENATMFSPKETHVRVSAHELNSGGVLIDVSDNGVGISDTRLAEINRRLDNPPVIDASVGRHMGLFAVAHLSQRHGVRVRLRAGFPQGLTALVWLPDSIIERGVLQYGGWSQPFASQADFQARRTTGRHSIAIRSAADDQSTNEQDGAGRYESVQAVDPALNWFRSRRPSAAGVARDVGRPSAASPYVDVERPSEADGWAAGRHAAQIIADPVYSDRTVVGLPVRVPQANLIPGSISGGRQAGSGATSSPADRDEAQTPASTRPPRSPEVARFRLSGFQRGARRAEGGTPTGAEGGTPRTGAEAETPTTGEEADR